MKAGWSLGIAALALMPPLAVIDGAQSESVQVPARPASPSFGDPIPGLTDDESALFAAGRDAFEEEEGVADGLGPVFNNISCASCHGAPATGGGRALGTATTILETRFGAVVGGTFDPLEGLGGSLIQTSGIGAPCGAGETVPAAATVFARRRTTPLFGLGLVDAVPDQTFFELATAQEDGVRGRVQLVQNLITGEERVGKFGWKAQVPSLAQFSGDAYLNEMGITSPFFPDENCPQGICSLLQECDFVLDPEDGGEDVDAFTDFMTMLGAPPRDRITGQARNGEVIFGAIGCATCHVASLTTGSDSPVAALHDVTFHPYSDFLLHDMGSLGDGIVQGRATGREMRTAPLWGLRTGEVFLHDGRATTVEEAILAHDGQAQPARDRFEGLTQGEKNMLLGFLNSL